MVLAAGRSDRADRAEGTARRVPQDTSQCYHKLATTGLVTMFAEPNTLPRAQRQLAVRDRNA